MNASGNALISRVVRDDLRVGAIDQFRIHVICNPTIRTPILTVGGTTFLWVRHLDLCIVAVAMSNTNPTLVFEFMFRFIAVCNAYIGELNEEGVKKNFIMMYELLDEMMDFGYPETSDTQALKSYVVSENLHGVVPVRPNMRGATMDVSADAMWRPHDVKYRKNQCFVDVFEMLHLFVSSQGTIVRADVEGSIKMCAFLTGMPECLMSLNSSTGSSQNNVALSVRLNECSYHPCVRFTTSNGDSCMLFVPPDGEFELMRYTATKNVRLPVRIHAMVETPHEHALRYQVVLRTCVDPQVQVSDVVIRIPAPQHASLSSCDVRIGKAKWDSNEHEIVWRIPRVQGMTEWMLRAEAALAPALPKQWDRPPIQVDFAVPSITASGLMVRYLQITERSNYRAVKWVRYETHARHSYQVQI